jgi:hypothetical protein
MIQGVSMNAISVRPHTKFAAALMAAGVVSAASIVGVPEHRSLPVINIDVANASVITDALYGFGDAVNGVASGVALTLDGAISLPFDGLSAALIASQNPSLAPSLMSWLIQRYANPSDLYPYYSYPKEIKNFSIEPLAGLLPSPIGSSIIDAVNQIADAINGGLSGLPDPAAGEFATGAFWDTDIGRTVNSANFALFAPVWMLYETAYYLGYLPANLEATVESAIQDPSEIPGLVSNLAYDLLSPDPEVGLLGGLLYYATLPLTNLPGPVGELSTNFVIAISDGIDGLLARLPAPIEPTPFPTAASQQLSVMSVEENSVSDASLAVTGGITLSIETGAKVEATSPEALNTAPTTPQDLGPAAGDIDPDANKVRSGNKVEPGDKFDNQAKDETVKDDGAVVPAVGGDEVVADDPTVAADPTDTETEGADDPAPADSEAAA